LTGGVFGEARASLSMDGLMDGLLIFAQEIPRI
jgi:hypothetical protein